jgi:multidrug transporter EmrE-like cation transporter
MLGLTILSVILGAFGQILVKTGARNLELDFSMSHLFPSLIQIIKNIPVMSGMFLYGLSFLLWIKVLSKTELSYAYPFVSLGYVLIMIFSFFVFKESITVYKMIGTAFIIIGVLFVARS